MKVTTTSAKLLYAYLPDGATLVTDRAVKDDNHPIGMALIKYDTGIYAAYNAGVTSPVDQHEAELLDRELNGDTPTINDLLTAYRVTQTELSRRYDIPLRTVQHWCNGTRQPAGWIINIIEICLQAGLK